LIEPLLRENLRRAYPGAFVYTFQGAGHFPYLVVPEEYLRVLEEFLEGKGIGDRG
jgi:pimeloyl-ACP methyl ester carboxylesterase